MGTADRLTAAVDGRGDDRRRELNRPAFVLHSRPWKETSLVLELFTRSHGRVAAVAKGARRPHSQLRGVLMAFAPLQVTWSGKGELRLLHAAEWQGGIPQLSGVSLLCGFYLNELLMKVLAREDPHERLFDAYQQAIRSLTPGGGHAAALRRFERQLLVELGYAVALVHDAASGAPLRPDERYRYHPERGALLLDRTDGDGPCDVLGKTLIDMARDDYADATTAAESKRLLRHLIHHHLGQPELQTRLLIKELQQI